MRYAWTELNLNGKRSPANHLLNAYMRRFRTWDQRAASRVHALATNSQTVSQRIRLAYGRTASIIFPPVEIDRFSPTLPREGYFVTVTRLVPHKRVDLLVHTFNQLNLPLLVVGDGPELPRLKATAKSNVSFLGFQSDETVADLLGRARAYVCAAEEDFGIAIVEAQAAGCPVIAYGSGGALETVIENKTGVFFREQTVESITQAIQDFERFAPSFNMDDLISNARLFHKSRFLNEFMQFVEAGK
jgi:glycosyltransferase involved in cell wall biosynthesis